MGGPQAPDHGSGICVSPRVALQPGQTAVVDATRAGPGGGLPAGAWFSAHVVPQIPPNSTEYIPAPIRYWLSALPGSRCFWPGMEWADATVAQATAEAFYVWAPLPQVRRQGGGGEAPQEGCLSLALLPKRACRLLRCAGGRRGGTHGGGGARQHHRAALPAQAHDRKRLCQAVPPALREGWSFTGELRVFFFVNIRTRTSHSTHQARFEFGGGKRSFSSHVLGVG